MDMLASSKMCRIVDEAARKYPGNMENNAEILPDEQRLQPHGGTSGNHPVYEGNKILAGVVGFCITIQDTLGKTLQEIIAQRIVVKQAINKKSLQNKNGNP